MDPSNPQPTTVKGQQAHTSENGSAPKLDTAKGQGSGFTGRSLKFQKRMRFQPESVKFNKKGLSRHEYYKDLLEDDSKSDVEVPRAVCVADRVESSAKEMKAMLRAVSQHTSNRAVLQKIPRHMRRRAASHNKKRLPRRLHQLADELSAHAQNEGAEKLNKPPPKRKKRRRKVNLQNEYSKRAGKCGWLETHIWHAKRFHMSESNDPKYTKWGNRIALYPNDKSFRACHRAVSKHCLIQDISYMRCLYLSGHRDNLGQLFEDVCDIELDPLVLEGRKESEVILSKVTGFDDQGCKIKECVGPMSVLWESSVREKEQSGVFVWIHPVISSSSLDIFNSVRENRSLKVDIHDITDSVLRFRLTGPKSSVTLLSVLRPMNEFCAADGEKKLLSDWMVENKDIISQLHREFIAFATDCHRSTFARTGTAATSDDVMENSDGSLFPVITNDPRLILPLDKTTPTLAKSKKDLEENSKIAEEETKSAGATPPSMEEMETPCLSPLWIENIRNEVAGSRKPDHIVSTRKCEQKFKSKDEEKEVWRKSLATAVPIVAIRRVPNEDVKFNLPAASPKTAHSGPDGSFAAGWDIVVPRNWGTAFWVPLIYSRARAGGLREKRNTNLEHLRPHFPEDFPDTVAGREFWNAEAHLLSTKHYRKPPAKRPNYSVFAVRNPFQPDWSSFCDDLLKCAEVVEEGTNKLAEGGNSEEPSSKKPKLELGLLSSPTSNVVTPFTDAKDCKDDVEQKETQSEIDMIPVMREDRHLLALQECIRRLVESNCSDMVSTTSHFKDLGINKRHLICVGLISLNKGIPFSRSMICAPSNKDIQTLCEELCDPYKYGLQSVTGPIERKHGDPYRKERKEARKQAKKNKKEKTLITSEELPGKDSEICADSSSLPKKPQCFPVAPSREVIGYVTSGDFVYSYGCGAGIGFIAVEKLHTLAVEQARNEKLGAVLVNPDARSSLMSGSPHVPLLALMRNTNSLQYRFVKLEIIKPW